MRKKRRHEEHENHDRWLITYADMITLLMVFFIVLYAMSNVEKSKAESLIESMYNAFNHIAALDTTSGGNQPNIAKPPVPPPKPSPDNNKDQLNEPRLQQLKQQLQHYVNEHKLNLVITLSDTQRGIELSLKDVILFDSGKAQLKPDFLSRLNEIIGLLKAVDNPLSIEGHTDNQPIKTHDFPSNWELSAGRAISVLRYIEKQGISPQRLQFSGYGEYRPMYPNDTPEHRQANRRVNIIILRNK